MCVNTVHCKMCVHADICVQVFTFFGSGFDGCWAWLRQLTGWTQIVLIGKRLLFLQSDTPENQLANCSCKTRVHLRLHFCPLTATFLRNQVFALHLWMIPTQQNSAHSYDSFWWFSLGTTTSTVLAFWTTASSVINVLHPSVSDSQSEFSPVSMVLRKHTPK